MAMIDGVGDYLSSTYAASAVASAASPQSTEAVDKAGQSDEATSAVEGVTAPNFDTVEVSAAGRAYQSQSDQTGKESEDESDSETPSEDTSSPAEAGITDEIRATLAQMA